MKGLTSLNLRNNGLKDVSFLKDLDNLTDVDLDDNPIETPPPEIVKQGLDAIRAYLRSLDIPAKKKLNEVKVLLIGDGGSGKTSLVKQLQNLPFNPNESKTHGINIATIDFHCNRGDAGEDTGNNTIHARFWDFGGQEIMHASHQFFLSTRSLYILVLDGRKDPKTEYWLKHIQGFGGNSPILIVLNKIDDHHSFDVDRKTLTGKYKNIAGFYRTSCKTRAGIDDLKKALETELPQTELMKTEVAESWLNVKEELERVTKECHYINHKQFLDICGGLGITGDSARTTLVRFLNELGVVLHFKELYLKDYHVLNPCWVTEAVYKIINSPFLAQNNGILPEDKLEYILNEETIKEEEMELELPDITYTVGEQHYIVSLMERFELCYACGNGTLLFPDLLPLHAPPTEGLTGGISFIVTYNFLPRSVIARLMVRLNRQIKGDIRWRSGVMLEKTALKTLALVRADYEERRIYIRVSGDRPREHLSIIRHTLADINDSFGNLGHSEKIPLPLPPQIREKYPEDKDVPAKFRVTVSYDFLTGYEEQGIDRYFEGETKTWYRVSELLDGVVKREDRLKARQAAGHGRDGGEMHVVYHAPAPEPSVIEEYERKQERLLEELEKSKNENENRKRIDELKLELEKKDKLQLLCREEAHKKARKSMRPFLLISAGVVAALGVFLYIYLGKWEKLEPLTFWAPLAWGVISGAYYLFSGKKLNSEDNLNARFEEELKQQYILNSFDVEEYAALQQELDQRRRTNYN